MKLNLITKHAGTTTKKSIKNLIEDIDSNKRRFQDLLGMTTLISVDSRKAEEKPLNLKTRIEKAAVCYNLIIEKYKIHLTYDKIPNSLQTGKMLEAELFSILLNVLSNSIKSVIARGKEKQIKIIARKTNKGKVINVMDTGIGIDLDESNELFVPFTADPTGKLYSSLNKIS